MGMSVGSLPPGYQMQMPQANQPTFSFAPGQNYSVDSQAHQPHQQQVADAVFKFIQGQRL